MLGGCEPRVAKVTILVRFSATICFLLCHSINVNLDFRYTYPVAVRRSWKIRRSKL